jgi:hypothetical protein
MGRADSTNGRECRISVIKLEKRDHWEHQDVDGLIILKCISDKIAWCGLV